MKFFKQAFFFMASVMLLTACENTHHVNSRLFSLDIPDGYLDDPALSVPLDHGYSICYEYLPYGTDNVIATETFTPEEIM